MLAVRNTLSFQKTNITDHHAAELVTANNGREAIRSDR
jgi:hypothetical protein